MSRPRLRFLIAACVFAAVAVGATSSARTASLSDTVIAGSPEIAGSADVSGPLMIELEAEPAAVVYAEEKRRGASDKSAGEAGKQRKEANERDQRNVLSRMQSAGIQATPLYQVQTTYNGIAVQAPPGAAANLAALPGVKAVHQIPLAQLENHYSVPFIGAKQAWEAFGKTGKDFSVAILDTGVDYVHTGFAGRGTSSDLTTARSAAANPPQASDNPGTFRVLAADGHQIYPSAKVVGGFDLVGDNYNAVGTAAQQVPVRDPNPMDCNGHGTHVAGSAAGTGVKADGTTFTGPYNTALDTAAMRIGPGVAPKADIYALRVFGCAGSTAVTTAAIEWATDPNRDGDPSDHVDVINMSLGSANGTPDDPSAAASNTAALAGVIVVASAGNSGDSYYVTGSPGSATRVISVASSRDAAERADAIIVPPGSPIAGTYIASRSVNFNWAATPERTGNVYYPTTNQHGCQAWTGPDAANIAGRIVLVDWRKDADGTTFPCGSGVRANNAALAGATGIIMGDNVPFLDTAIGGNASVPAMYTTSTVKARLLSQLTPGAVSTLNVTLSSLVRGDSVLEPLNDTLSSFSSRGPRSRDTALKPDISAPGQTIWSANVWSLSHGRSLNGTSMAAPHMAGVMALLKEAHPAWTGEELKALAMNTAGHDLWSGFSQSGNRFGVGRVGSGRVDIPAALASNSIAMNADGLGGVSVSFGSVEAAGTHTATKTIRVVNRGSSAQTYNVSYDAITSIPGVSYSFPDGTSLSVPAGGSGTFRVQLTANAAAMQNTRDATVDAMMVGNPRHWLSEASGNVMVAPSSGTALRVPVYASARPASTTKSAPKFLNLGKDTTAKINIAGEGVNSGAEPLGYLTKVSAFELQFSSGPAALGTGVSPLARGGDIEHVGVSTKADTLHFGISAHGEWSSAATDQQFTIQVDRNNDGNADWHAFNTRFVIAPNSDPTDVFVVAGQNLPAGALAVTGFTNIFNSNVNTALLDNSVMVLPVPTSALGLPAGQTSFKYRVVGSSRFWGTIETTPWLSYNYASPGLSFSDGIAGRPIYPAIDGQKIDVTYNAAAYAANASSGVLLLHHFNQQGRRSEVLEVRTR